MPSVVRTRISPLVAAVVGGTYSAAAQFRAVSTTRNGRVNIAWFNAGQVFLSRSSGGWVSVTSAAWIGAQLVGATAPASTAFMALEHEFDANFGDQFYADQMVIATGTNPAWAPGGYSANAKFILERSEDGGLSWVEVRRASRDTPADLDAGLSAAQATIYDRESILRAPVRWRGLIRTGTTNIVYSAAVTTADFNVNAKSFWLRDPSDPTRDIAVAQVDMQVKEGPGVAGTTLYPEGRDLPVVVHGDRPSGAIFELKLWSLTQAQNTAIMKLLQSKRVLFLQDTLGMKWYLKLTGDISTERMRAIPSSGENFPIRHFHQVTAEVTEVATPDV